MMLIFVMAKSSPEIPTNGSDQLGDQVHPAEERLILAIPSQDMTTKSCVMKLVLVFVEYATQSV